MKINHCPLSIVHYPLSTINHKKLSISKTVILSVTNDLSTDQRVNKVANSLLNFGYSPILVGVKKRNSKPIIGRQYRIKRFRLLFKKGFLFYANYNICIFFYLLFSRADMFVSNDLDSLPANYFAYKLKRFFGANNLKIVYDSHELFTEVPELYNRNFVKKVWLSFEKFILPKLDNTYTVCQSIAQYYNDKYKVKMRVVQNMPTSDSQLPTSNLRHPSPDLPLLSSVFGLRSSDFQPKIILYQGALNVGRAIEHVINIMDRIDNAILLIVGKGDIEQDLHNMVADRKLQDKVIFTGSVPFEQLRTLTIRADIGLVLQEDMGLSYHYALPNRLFDFIQAGVPILASNQPEIKQIVHKENIGIVVDDFTDNTLLAAVNKLLNDDKFVDELRANIKHCAHKYCWETQEGVLREIYLGGK